MRRGGGPEGTDMGRPRVLCNDVERVLAARGCISRRRHPRLNGAISYLARRGELVRLLPGVYTRPSVSGVFEIRVLAVAEWDPDAVFTAETAARLTYWRDVQVSAITVCSQRRGGAPWLRISRGVILADQVVEVKGVRSTAPALTALDLTLSRGGGGIDQVLRTRAARLCDLHETLGATPGRPHNRVRRILLEDSRDEPWSEAERRLHRLLRAAGITGWAGNFSVEFLSAVYQLDVAFDASKVAIEVDGYEHHSSRRAFSYDRERNNALVCSGWLVLHFTWDSVTQRPDDVLTTIRTALGLRRGGVGSGHRSRPDQDQPSVSRPAQLAGVRRRRGRQHPGEQ